MVKEDETQPMPTGKVVGEIGLERRDTRKVS